VPQMELHHLCRLASPKLEEPRWKHRLQLLHLRDVARPVGQLQALLRELMQLCCTLLVALSHLACVLLARTLHLSVSSLVLSLSASMRNCVHHCLWSTRIFWELWC
jgi:hypothetical protein